jgi:hypothetical protein
MADGHFFVAPDNGLLGRVLFACPNAQVHRVEPHRLGIGPISRTFHGRDLFAPVAAELAANRLNVEQLGPRQSSPVVQPWPLPQISESRILGHVIAIDRFGNLITDIAATMVVKLDNPIVEVGSAHCTIAGTYSDVSPGELLAIVGSCETLEIACRNGNASELLGVNCGAQVVVRPTIASATALASE